MMSSEREIERLQGYWFPLRISHDGRITAVNDPAVSSPRDVPMMTILGNTIHVTAGDEYYWTGGRLWVDPSAGRLAYIYSPLRQEFDTMCAYELNDDELRICSGGFPWSGQHDFVTAGEYRRIAVDPPADVRVFIETIMAGQYWTAHTELNPTLHRTRPNNLLCSLSAKRADARHRCTSSKRY